MPVLADMSLNPDYRKVKNCQMNLICLYECSITPTLHEGQIKQYFFFYKSSLLYIIQIISLNKNYSFYLNNFSMWCICKEMQGTIIQNSMECERNTFGKHSYSGLSIVLLLYFLICTRSELIQPTRLQAIKQKFW